jgi:hypothetical protein
LSASSGVDRDTIDRLATLLAEELGPIARCVVRRAAEQGAVDAAALLQQVADTVLPASHRPRFIERARAAIGNGVAAGPAARVAAPPPSGAVLPLLGQTALDSAFVQAAQTLVARRIGPIAVWMARRAGEGAASREQFINRFASMAAEGHDRERLLEALCRLRAPR